jgi:hypothetical protein
MTNGKKDTTFLWVRPKFKRMLKAKASLKGKNMTDLTEEMAEDIENELKQWNFGSEPSQNKKRGFF